MYNYTSAPPVGFHPDFALCVALPLAQAAYAVMNPANPVHLPPGYEQTALIKADEPAIRALLAQVAQDAPSPVVRALFKLSPIFGLIGKNTATKTAFVSFRGTQTVEDWINNFDSLAAPYRFLPDGGLAHKGFQDVYGLLRASVMAGLSAAAQGSNRLIVTGHSLGGALAVLAAPDIAKNSGTGLAPELITFAGPAAGLADFAHFFDRLVPTCYRVVNFWDVVPRVPPQFPVGLFDHVGTAIHVDPGFADVVKAHSLELSYVPGLLKLLPAGFTC